MNRRIFFKVAIGILSAPLINKLPFVQAAKESLKSDMRRRCAVANELMLQSEARINARLLEGLQKREPFCYTAGIPLDKSEVMKELAANVPKTGWQCKLDSQQET